LDYQTWGVNNPDNLETITIPDKLKFLKNIDGGKENKCEVVASVVGLGDVEYEYVCTEDDTPYKQAYHPAFCDKVDECNFPVVYTALNSGKNNLYVHDTMVQPIPTYEIHDDVITTKWQCGAGLRALNIENLAYPAENSKLKIHMVPSKDNVQIIVTDGDNYAIKDVKVSVDVFSFPIIERGDVCLEKGQVEITDEYGSVDFYIPDQSNISDDILCRNQDKSLVNSQPAEAPILIKATHPNHPSQEAEIVFDARYSGGDTFGEKWHLASGDTAFTFLTQLSLNPVGPKTLTGKTLSFVASATNEGQEKETFSLENNPQGASINSDTGIFAWTPTDDQRGKEYVFDVVVSAGQDTDKEKIVAVIKELGSEDGMTKKLISLWIADENSFDSKGSNHGTPENNPTFTQGVSGMAFDFTGNKDNIFIGNPASLNPTEEITLEAWVSVLGNENSHRQIIGKDDGGAQRSYLLTASDLNKYRGNVEVENSGLAWCDSITEIQMGEWYHVAQTFDGNTLKVYVNGKEECSAAGVGKIKTTSEPVRIGNNNPDTSNFDFIGKIDEVGIHNYALSPSEIKKII